MEYLAELAREGRRTLIEFPDCSGCETFAEPDEDVMEVAREALEGWLETHLEFGEAPPQPSPRRKASRSSLAVRVNPALTIALLLRWRRQ